MTIKLVLLKSGEDIVSDVSEMIVGEEGNEENPQRVIGYYLSKPCLVKITDVKANADLKKGSEQKAGYSVTLFPWMPLSKEEKIPIPADWMVTMVEPVTKLREMYIEDVVTPLKEESKKDGKDDKSDSTDNDTADSDQSD